MRLLNKFRACRGSVTAFVAALIIVPRAVAIELPCNPSLFVTTQAQGGDGGPWAMVCAAEPWAAKVSARALNAAQHTVRVFDDIAFVVHRDTGIIERFDAATGQPIDQFALGEDSQPHDILVMDDQTVYITRQTETHLLRLDLETGMTSDVADLSIFADDDGVPELAMMARDGNHLFIQVQRRNAESPTGFVEPGMLAVFDLDAQVLIDVDPGQSGVQAIELLGPLPQHKMQIDPALRRLYVTATGDLLTGAGGIEMIDLDTFASLGYALSATNVPAHIGAFTMVSATRGYFISHTDLALSSHLLGFRIGGEPDQTGKIVLTLGWLVTTLEYDPVTRLVFYPDGNQDAPGVHVIDTATGAVLTPQPIGVGGRPTDLAIVQRCRPDLNTSGEVDVLDLLALLTAWGESGSFMPEDLDQDGLVTVTDLLILLGAWGVCPML